MEDHNVEASAAQDSSKWKSSVLEYTKSILIAVALALVIRAFVVQAYEIPSGSMEDTLAIGDRILVNKFVYGAKIPFTDHRILEVRAPRRGDVIVFQYPMDPSKDFIKRVVGLPGDRIQIIDKKVYVNGQQYWNQHEVHKQDDLLPKILSPRDNTEVITVPDDSYFVMGDNRDSSYDSRFWGFVSRQKIEGLAFIKYWSWDSTAWQVRWSSIGKPID
jgi:signal peptidase I